MNVEIILEILGILLIFGDHYGYADVRELDLYERQYLPALDNEENREYLPPPEANNHLNEMIDSLEKKEEELPYIYSLPQVLNDPSPDTVYANQPLKLDFSKEEIPFKPIFKGALISGLFLPDIDTQPTNNNNLINLKDQLKESKKSKEYGNFRLPFNIITTKAPTYTQQQQQQQQIEIRSPLNTQVEYNRTSSEKPLEVEQNNKHLPNPANDIVLINHRKETTTEYKLFNDEYDDAFELSYLAPEVIYKPGDDLSFIDDTSVIDDYEHVFPSQMLKKPNSTSTTKSPEYEEGVDTSKSIENDTSGHGYVYERPKIPFNF